MDEMAKRSVAAGARVGAVLSMAVLISTLIPVAAHAQLLPFGAQASVVPVCQFACRVNPPSGANFDGNIAGGVVTSANLPGFHEDGVARVNPDTPFVAEGSGFARLSDGKLGVRAFGSGVFALPGAQLPLVSFKTETNLLEVSMSTATGVMTFGLSITGGGVGDGRADLALDVSVFDTVHGLSGRINGIPEDRSPTVELFCPRGLPCSQNTTISINVTAGVPVLVVARFRAFAGDGDANHLSTASLTASGVPFTSASGVFLTDQGGPPPPAADTTPPTTIATPSPGPNANGWNNTDVVVRLDAMDDPGGSGVKEVRFSLSGAQGGAGTVAGSNAAVTISAEGTTTITFFSRDNAGNQEAAMALEVRIDKTPPVIAGLPSPGCTLWPPNHRLVQVAAVTANDGLSGLAPGALTVRGTSNEPDNGPGDGSTTPDVVIAGNAVQLRAERSGASTGRIYTLTAEASDLAGNVASATANCVVPHDQ